MSEIDNKRIVADLRYQTSKEVMPYAAEIGVSISRMRRRFRCRVRVSRGFDGVAGGRRAVIRCLILAESVHGRYQRRRQPKANDARGMRG